MLFQVMQTRAVSKNGHQETPAYFNVQDPAGRVLFSFPQGQRKMAEAMADGLNAAVALAMDDGMKRLAAASLAALEVLERYPDCKVTDYRKAATKLRLAVQPYKALRYNDFA